MNRKIGIYSSAANLLSVICFALCMLFHFDEGSYFSSMLIAFSFVAMMCGYAYYSKETHKLAGYISAAFAAVYAALILQVYFAQLTTVRLDHLTQQAINLLDFQKFGLLFNYDLLGYALMALSTFFAGLAVHVQTRADKWLKYLLMVHGVFFLSCLVVPMVGVFQADGPKWIGVALLEFWCAYFCPIAILSLMHFSACKE